MKYRLTEFMSKAFICSESEVQTFKFEFEIIKAFN